MEIISTIHALDQGIGTNPVPVHESSLQEAENHEDENPGLFARLLDALKGKSQKNVIDDSDKLSQTKPVKELTEEEASLAGLGTAFLEKQIALSLEKPQNENSSLKIGEETVLSPIDMDMTEEKLGLLKLNPENNTEKHELSIAGEKNFLKNALEPVISNADGANLSNFSSEHGFLEDDHAKLMQNVENSRAEKKAAVDIFPARNQENRFYQFSGEPKPAAVDVFARSNEAQDAQKHSDSRLRRHRERVVVEVRDFRTNENQASSTTDTVNNLNTAFSKGEKATVDIPVELSLSAARDSAAKPGEIQGQNITFQEALSQRFHEGLNTEIVRHAAVFLRNDGEGTIRLSLRPESLGNIKIRLEMSENKIVGHIIVENSEAFRAFERELPVLERAFQDSGFSETNLEMFMAHDYGSHAQGQPNQDFLNVLPETAMSNYESEADKMVFSGDLNGQPEDLSAKLHAVNMLI